MTLPRTALILFSLLALPAHASPAETLASIPSSAAQDDKTLWPQVMSAYYGAYDEKQDCWISTAEDQSYCMKPQSLTRVTDGKTRLFYLSVAGMPLGDGNDCAACTGALGLMVLSDAGPTLQLVARSEPYMEAGGNGRAPDEEEISLQEIGKPGNRAWAVSSGWMGQGISVTVTDLYAVVGKEVKPVGQFPTAFDDEGNCDNGINVETSEKCSDVSFELAYEDGETGSDFMPITLKSSGTLKGKPFTETFTAAFDRITMTYARPAGLPEEVSP